MSGIAGRKTFAAVGVLLVLVVSAVAMLRLSGAPWNDPLLGPAEYDFGEIPINTPMTMHLGLVNQADEVLFLRNVTRSCKCATVEVTPEKVAPGATVDVAVTMTVDDTSGNQARITLIFETSDGELARNLLVTARGAE